MVMAVPAYLQSEPLNDHGQDAECFLRVFLFQSMNSLAISILTLLSPSMSHDATMPVKRSSTISLPSVSLTPTLTMAGLFRTSSLSRMPEKTRFVLSMVMATLSTLMLLDREILSKENPRG